MVVSSSSCRRAAAADEATCKALAIAIGTGWLPFYQLRHLEATCTSVCRESRLQVARKVRVTAETPRTLWCRPPPCGVSSPGIQGGGSGGSGGGTNSSGNGSSGNDGMGEKKRVRSAAGSADVSSPRTTTTTTATGDTFSRNKVPLVRVAGVVWALPAAELLAPGFRWPEGVKGLQFWPKFAEPLEGVVFPETLEALSFGFRFNGSLEPQRVRWPPRLKRLTLGASWNRRLQGARESWPACLEELHFGTCFDKPLAGNGVGLPRGLREISLGGVFNQPVTGVEWPAGLQKLTFSESFNQSLEGVCFPAGLRAVTFGGVFNSRGPVWPTGLRMLTFGKRFNQPFASRCGSGNGSAMAQEEPSPSHVLPAGLKVLVLGDHFDQPLSGSELPDGLERLVIGNNFGFVWSVRWPSGLKRLRLSCELNDYSLRRWRRRRGGRVSSAANNDGSIRSRRRSADQVVMLPAGLEHLDLGSRFNLPLSLLSLPQNLKVLDLGDTFDQPLGEPRGGEGGKEEEAGDALAAAAVAAAVPTWLPDGLEELRLGPQFSGDVESIRLPRGLKRLLFSEASRFNRGVAGVEWPAGLEELAFGNLFDQPMEGCVLPGGLRELRFGWLFAHSLVGGSPWAAPAGVLPEGLERLTLCERYPKSHLRGLEWPRRLRSVRLGRLVFTSRERMARWLANPTLS